MNGKKEAFYFFFGHEAIDDKRTYLDNLFFKQ